MSYRYYVGIAVSRRKECSRFIFVTSIDEMGLARWEPEKAALAFTSRSADDLVKGLLAAGFPACVIKTGGDLAPVNEV